jgi:hypothetical protein
MGHHSGKIVHRPIQFESDKDHRVCATGRRSSRNSVTDDKIDGGQSLRLVQQRQLCKQRLDLISDGIECWQFRFESSVSVGRSTDRATEIALVDVKLSSIGGKSAAFLAQVIRDRGARRVRGVEPVPRVDEMMDVRSADFKRVGRWNVGPTGQTRQGRGEGQLCGATHVRIELNPT